MTHSDAYLNITTPENVEFGYEVAGLGSRFLAAVIDSILIIVLLIVANLAMAFFANLLDLFETVNVNWIVAIFTLISFILFWGFYIVFEFIWQGQTPGKRRFNIRVIRTDGAPIGFTETLIRNLVRIIDFVPLYGLGVIVMFFNNRSRRFGDLAANTLVVHDQNVSLESLAAATQTQSYQTKHYETGQLELPVERLQESDVVLAEEFLLRENKLTNAMGLVRPILRHLYKKMEMPLEEKMRYSEGVDRLRAIVNARRESGGATRYSESG